MSGNKIPSVFPPLVDMKLEKTLVLSVDWQPRSRKRY